jgi:four helix bundle protein
MNNYKNLKIWQEAMELAVDVYQLTKSFPKEETHGLTSQLRRAAISIPSNIAEGACRNNDREFKQFLGIAYGSTGEVDTQLHMAFRLEYITEDTYNKYQERIERIQKMNYNLQTRLLESLAGGKPKTQDSGLNNTK